MTRKLARKSDHRSNLMRNLITSLVLYETVTTTTAKAKETKHIIEKLIARSKKNDLNTKKTLYGTFFDRNAAKKMSLELIPRYEGRESGFIKIYRLKNRLGDNASMSCLELVDKKKFVKKEVKEPEKSKTE